MIKKFSVVSSVTQLLSLLSLSELPPVLSLLWLYCRLYLPFNHLFPLRLPHCHGLLWSPPSSSSTVDPYRRCLLWSPHLSSPRHHPLLFLFYCFSFTPIREYVETLYFSSYLLLNLPMIHLSLGQEVKAPMRLLMVLRSNNPPTLSP